MRTWKISRPSGTRSTTWSPSSVPRGGDTAGNPEQAAGPEPGALIRRIGDRFSDPALLRHALRHRSWCAENAGQGSNERLEFLGDAVLGLVVTDYIYRTYKDLPEGELAKVRAAVVNSEALAEVAQELGVGEGLLLGRGEDLSGGREKPSILADAMEAIIGAVYLDGGWHQAEALVMGLLSRRIAEAAAGPGGQDYKTRLQELASRIGGALPRYEVVDEGPDHAKRFFATVQVGERITGHGEGRSKKQAEQAAARRAWQRLADDDSLGGGEAPVAGGDAPVARAEGAGPSSG